MSDSKFAALSEVLSPRTQKVVALFENELRDVRFPDVDVEILEALLQHILEAHVEVQKIEQALEAARARRSAHVEALDAVVPKALAYARVYSESDKLLRERVAEADREYGPAAASAPSSKRGRAKKRAVESDLFAEETTSETHDAQPTLM
jgi:hypothetical protein